MDFLTQLRKKYSDLLEKNSLSSSASSDDADDIPHGDEDSLSKASSVPSGPVPSKFSGSLGDDDPAGS